MTKIIEFYNHASVKDDWKTQYIKYRIGRIRHYYWLWNRKRPNNLVIDQHDLFVLQNCQPGFTVFYGSAGYYLQDLFPNIQAIEHFSIVKSFYPNAIVCQDKDKLAESLPQLADNFAVVNNRGDHWVDSDGLTEWIKQYIKAMNPGCRFFYSFRDTQITGVNRLLVDIEQHYLEWAQSLEALGLTLVWSDINFRKKLPDANGNYDTFENPDSTNGNIKFAFVYQGQPWTIV